MSQSGVKPTPRDLPMSAKHLEDSIHYHMSHAKEHMDEAKKAHKMLESRHKEMKKYGMPAVHQAMKMRGSE